MERILIVEDDEIIQKLIECRLTALGYEVCARADSGEDAVFSAIEHNPDVILMDIRLKGSVDGIDAAKIIRKSLPPSIIFLTGLEDDDTLRRVKAFRPDGFILKPFSDNDLRVALALVRGGPGRSVPAAR